MIGVYKITSPSGKVYIGSSNNIEKRWRYYYRLECKGQRKLYNSFKKHGVLSHKFEIIEECLFDELYNKENYYGKLFNSIGEFGLNLALPKSDDAPAVLSESTKKLRSIMQTKDKNNFWGKTHSDLTKNKISQANKGKVPHNKGVTGAIKMSFESKTKMRKAQLGRKHSEVTKDKIRMNNTKAKLLVNLETGIFYYGMKEAAEGVGVKEKKLYKRLIAGRLFTYNIVYA